MTDASNSTTQQQPRAWETHITVATVVEDNGRYLMVEEYISGRLTLNQPAGHLESGESLIDAARRETLEETCWEVDIQGLLGSCLYTLPDGEATYLRTTFFAYPIRQRKDQAMDPDIQRAVWMTFDEISECKTAMRSPRVKETIEQYRSGHRYPLEFIYGVEGHVPGR